MHRGKHLKKTRGFISTYILSMVLHVGHKLTYMVTIETSSYDVIYLLLSFKERFYLRCKFYSTPSLTRSIWHLKTRG